MTLASSRSTVGGLLAGIQGLNVYEKAPGSLTCPAAIIGFDSGVAPDFLGDGAALQMHVRLFVQWGDQDAAQDQLDGLLEATDPGSVVGCLLASDGLGQITWDSYGLLEYGGIEYLGAIIHAEVFD